MVTKYVKNHESLVEVFYYCMTIWHIISIPLDILRIYKRVGMSNDKSFDAIKAMKLENDTSAGNLVDLLPIEVQKRDFDLSFLDNLAELVLAYSSKPMN